VMCGETLEEVGFTEEIVPPYFSVKEAVFPFTKFRAFDPILGPEMRSTGEVMGIADSFGMAFAKAQEAADNELPLEGAIFVTVSDDDKPSVMPIVGRFHEMGFTLYATEGTAQYLKGRGIPARAVRKVHEGRPNGIDLMVNGDVQLLINTPLGKHAQHDDYLLRRTAIAQRVSYTTTMSAATAACDAILALRSRRASVRSLQEWHSDGTAARNLAGNRAPGAPADLAPGSAPPSGVRPPRLASREAST
jgi:carbamoyl-phosphate synthase large subunit